MSHAFIVRSADQSNASNESETTERLPSSSVFFSRSSSLQLVRLNGEHSLHLFLAIESKRGQSTESSSHFPAGLGLSDDRNARFHAIDTRRRTAGSNCCSAEREAANPRRERRARQAEIVLCEFEQMGVDLGADLLRAVSLQSRLHHLHCARGELTAEKTYDGGALSVLVQHTTDQSIRWSRLVGRRLLLVGATHRCGVLQLNSSEQRGSAHCSRSSGGIGSRYSSSFTRWQIVAFDRSQGRRTDSLRFGSVRLRRSAEQHEEHLSIGLGLPFSHCPAGRLADVCRCPSTLSRPIRSRTRPSDLRLHLEGEQRVRHDHHGRRAVRCPAHR